MIDDRALRLEDLHIGMVVTTSQLRDIVDMYIILDNPKVVVDELRRPFITGKIALVQKTKPKNIRENQYMHHVCKYRGDLINE